MHTISVKLSVKNVPIERTESDIRKVFSPFGEINSVTFPVYKNTGLRIDICFVEFATQNSAVRAYYQLSGDYLGADLPIEIRFIDPLLELHAAKGGFGIEYSGFACKKIRHF